MYVLAPSLLGADFKNLERDIKAVEEAGASWIHLVPQCRMGGYLRTD